MNYSFSFFLSFFLSFFFISFISFSFLSLIFVIGSIRGRIYNRKMPWVVPGYYQEPYGGGGRNRGGGREGEREGVSTGEGVTG